MAGHTPPGRAESRGGAESRGSAESRRGAESRGGAVPLESAIRAALADVSDPEIPGLSIVDLGIVRDVEVGPGRVRVELLPTFIGCPAIELIRAAVLERLAPFAATVEAEVTFTEPWTTERITPQGRRTLSERGFAPPAALPLSEDLLLSRDPPLSRDLPLIPTIAAAPCPWCGSTNTRLENVFGTTLCRAIAHCGECLQPFEQFKTV